MNSRMLTSVGALSFLSILQLVTQFALQRVLAERFGASADVDALQAALAIPSTLTTIVSVTLSFVLIPQLTTAFCRDRHSPDGWRLSAAIGVWLMLFLGAVTWLLSWNASGLAMGLYAGFDDSTQRIAGQSLYVLAWNLWLGLIVAWLSAVYHARMSFAWPAITALAAALINLFLASRWMEAGILGYAWSILVSGLVQVLLLALPYVRPLLLHGAWSHPELTPMIWRWMPLLVAGAYIRIDPIVDRYLGSFLEEGSIAHLGYAQRFIQAILAIATGGLLTVLLPNLNAAHNDPATGGFAERLRRGLQGMTLIVIPIVMGGFGFATWCVRDLLEQGAFKPHDTAEVAHLFRILLILLAGASFGDLFARGFYAMGDTRTPTIISIVAFTLGLIGKWWWVQSGGITGLTWGTSLYFFLSCSGLAVAMSYRSPGLIDRRWWQTVMKSLVSSLFACLLAYGIVWSMGRYGTWVAIPFAVMAYAIGLRVLRESLMIEMWFRAFQKTSSISLPKPEDSL